MNAERVLAEATVEILGDGKYCVKVIGVPPHDESREYIMEETSIDKAAFDAIDKFVKEMQERDG